MLPDSILKSLGRAYRQCIEKSAKQYDPLPEKPKNRNAWIGREAEKIWVADVLPNHTGVVEDSTGIDPPTAVSNTGDPRRTDAVAILAGETAQFELKKSDYGGTRVRNQIAAQTFCLGLGTYGARTLNVLYSDEGRIDIYTREQAEKQVKAAMGRGSEFETPPPSRSIHFAPSSAPADQPKPQQAQRFG